MNRRQLFTRLAAIAVAPAVVPVEKPASLGLLGLPKRVARMHPSPILEVTDFRKVAMSDWIAERSKDPQESKWLEHVMLKPHPSCTLYPQAS